MKWRYLILTEDYDLFGTNDEERAKQAFEAFMVYDSVTGEWMKESLDPKSTAPTAVREYIPYTEPLEQEESDPENDTQPGVQSTGES